MKLSFNIVVVWSVAVLTFLSFNALGQDQRDFMKRFLLYEEVESENSLLQYEPYDFSNVWMTAPNHLVFGIIGSEHQRIKIKFLEVVKSNEDPNLYLVKGKSSVQGNICDFSGSILLSEVKKVESLHFGVDSSYADSGIVSQGILIADYQFDENADQFHSGRFEGTCYSKWYLDSENRIRYDDIQSHSDGYMNNAFIGSWTNYKTGQAKLCRWGDFRVPLANQDFDIGAGVFSPSEKYYDVGWEVYQDAWLHGNEEAQHKEREAWW